MSYDIGPRIGIEGDAAFRKSLRGINESLKAMASEMKAVEAAYASGDQSAEKLRRQNELLSRQLEMQKTKLAELCKGLEKAREKFGDNDEVTQKWKRAVNDATAELSRMDRELVENADKLGQLEKENSALALAQKQAEEAAKRFRQEQARLADEVGKTSKKLQYSSEALREVKRTALIAGAALATLAVGSAKVGMDFESQMSKVGAISGASESEMEALNAKAKEMGINTKFSATESGQALEYMAMAGWKSEQMIAGLSGIMNLAAASGEDLGTVSDIVTDALTAFGLKASDSAHFADVLAKASAASNTNVAMMGETFKYAAPVAGALGYKIEDVSVAVGMMANAGIKGETAGTALRGMLTNLAKPTDQMSRYMDILKISMTDTQGQVKPLSQLLVELRTAFAGLTAAEKAEYAAGIAGKEAMSGMLALVNGSDADFNALTLSIANSNGSAKKMADTMNDNLRGQLTLLSSAAEGVGIAFYEKIQVQATNAVEELAKGVGYFGQKLESGALDKKLKVMASAAVAAGTALATLNATLAVKDVSNYISAVKLGGAALEEYESATKAGALAQGALNLAQSISPMGWVAIAAGTAVTALVTYAAMTHEGSSVEELLSQRIDETSEKLQEQTEAQKNLSSTRRDNISQINSEITAVQNYVAELQSYIDKNGRVKEDYRERAKYLTDQINNLIPNAVRVNGTERDSIYEISDAINDQIFAMHKKMALEAMQDEYTAALEGRSEAYKTLTQALRDQGAAELALQDARTRFSKARTPQEEASAGMAEYAMKQRLDESAKAAELAKNNMNDLNDTILAYNAIAVTNTETDLNLLTAGMGSEIVKNTNSNAEALAKAVSDVQLSYNQMLSESATCWNTLTETQKAARAEQLAALKRDLDAQVLEASAGGWKITMATGEGAAIGSYLFPETMRAMLQKGTQELEATGLKMPALGNAVGGGYCFGMTEKMSEVNAAAVKIAGTSLTGIQTTIGGSGTTSTEARKLGASFGNSFALGISDGKSNAVNNANSLATAVMNATKNKLSIRSPSGFMREGPSLKGARDAAPIPPSGAMMFPGQATAMRAQAMVQAPTPAGELQVPGFTQQMHAVAMRVRDSIPAPPIMQTENSVNRSTIVRHTGTIRVEGVNHANEMVDVVEIIMDELRRDNRR